MHAGVVLMTTNSACLWCGQVKSGIFIPPPLPLALSLSLWSLQWSVCLPRSVGPTMMCAREVRLFTLCQFSVHCLFRWWELRLSNQIHCAVSLCTLVWGHVMSMCKFNGGSSTKTKQLIPYHCTEYKFRRYMFDWLDIWLFAEGLLVSVVQGNGHTGYKACVSVLGVESCLSSRKRVSLSLLS